MKARGGAGIALILPLLVQAGTGIALALACWLVLARLPPVRDARLPVAFTLGQLVGAVALTGVVLLLVDLGRRLELRVSCAFPQVPAAGTIAKLLVFLAATAVAYRAFGPLTLPYLGYRQWLYSLTFVAVTVTLLTQLGLTLHANLEGLAFVLTSTGTRHRTVCPDCGRAGRPGATFCTSCGGTLRSSAPAGGRCRHCGAPVRPPARFCRACGRAAGGEAGPRRFCPDCRAPLDEEAVFCTACGVRLGGQEGGRGAGCA